MTHPAPRLPFLQTAERQERQKRHAGGMIPPAPPQFRLAASAAAAAETKQQRAGMTHLAPCLPFLFQPEQSEKPFVPAAHGIPPPKPFRKRFPPKTPPPFPALRNDTTAPLLKVLGKRMGVRGKEENPFSKGFPPSPASLSPPSSPSSTSRERGGSGWGPEGGSGF